MFCTLNPQIFKASSFSKLELIRTRAEDPKVSPAFSEIFANPRCLNYLFFGKVGFEYLVPQLLIRFEFSVLGASYFPVILSPSIMYARIHRVYRVA